jgi:hypothetical protein
MEGRAEKEEVLEEVLAGVAPVRGRLAEVRAVASLPGPADLTAGAAMPALPWMPR